LKLKKTYFRIFILIATITFSSCIVYIPKEYFDNYKLIKSKSIKQTPKLNGYYYSYFYDNKYCEYYFFFDNNLVASTSLPRVGVTNTVKPNADSLLTIWLNTKKFKESLNWSYYDFKNDTVCLYDELWPDPQNRFFSIASLSKSTAICKNDSLYFIGQVKYKITFLYLFKYTRVVKFKGTSSKFQTYPSRPDTSNNKFDLMYRDFLKKNSPYFYKQ
jgi:hypothetical protein